jgi:TRAP-type mannitol/chloroaromatic compound transport system permease large subunit
MIGPGLQIVIVFVVFLLLLAAGMTVPFAITVPAIFYLLLQGGLTGLKGLGLVSWGSMNSFTLTAIPLFILMAEILQSSGLSFRIYNGLARLSARIPGGLLQTNIAGCAVFAATADRASPPPPRSAAWRCRSCCRAATTGRCRRGRWRRAARWAFCFRRASR